MNSFEPLLVTTLTTPPVARPYSALYPPVMTSISSIASKLKFSENVPVTGSVMFVPSSRNVFSLVLAPPEDGFPPPTTPAVWDTTDW